MKVIDVQKISYKLQRKHTQQKVALIKFEENRFAVRRGIALLIFHANFSEFSHELTTRFDRQMYGKMKTSAFLARLFPSNLIIRFFYLIVFKYL